MSLKTKTWSRILPKLNSFNESNAPSKLFGGGCAYFQKSHSLLIFGGAKDIETSGKVRKKICLRDVKVFSFKSKTWTSLDI
jgi:hypothetical protein